MRVINDLIAYLTEYSKLFLVTFLFFNFKSVSRKRTAIVSVCSTTLIAALSIFNLLSLRSMVITSILLISFYIILQEKKNVLHYLLIYIYICIIDMVMNGFIMFILDMSISDVKQNEFRYHLLNMSSLIIIILMIAVKYQRHKTFEYKFSRNYTVTFAITGIAIAFYLTSFQMFAFSDADVTYRRLAALALGICSIVFIIITIKLQLKSMKNHSLEQEKIMTEKMMTSMEEYYLMLLKKEDETKAFRHDIKSHLYCISSLFNEGKYQEGRNYIDQLTNNLEKMKNALDTGNSLVNAIINDVSSDHPGVSITLKGHIPDNLEIPPYEICTILSNVLKNAFEAAEDTQDKHVEVILKVLENNINMTITNPYTIEPKTNGECFISVKSSSRGYGIRNAKNCIERINGDFNISFNDNTAVTRITLLNAISPVNKIVQTV